MAALSKLDRYDYISNLIIVFEHIVTDLEESQESSTFCRARIGASLCVLRCVSKDLSQIGKRLLLNIQTHRFCDGFIRLDLRFRVKKALSPSTTQNKKKEDDDNMFVFDRGHRYVWLENKRRCYIDHLKPIVDTPKQDDFFKWYRLM